MLWHVNCSNANSLITQSLWQFNNIHFIFKKSLLLLCEYNKIYFTTNVVKCFHFFLFWYFALVSLKVIFNFFFFFLYDTYLFTFLINTSACHCVLKSWIIDKKLCSELGKNTKIPNNSFGHVFSAMTYRISFLINRRQRFFVTSFGFYVLKTIDISRYTDVSKRKSLPL